MPDLLGVTNPVPGHDSNITNRNIPISPNNTQVQNVPDLNRVTSADNRTEQKDASQGGQIRFLCRQLLLAHLVQDGPEAAVLAVNDVPGVILQ